MEQIDTNNDKIGYCIATDLEPFSLPNWNWMVFDPIRTYYISEKPEKSGEFESESRSSIYVPVYLQITIFSLKYSVWMINQ